MNRQRLIIFTDLDGTLLDHHSYRWDAAVPALEKLAELEIPVILCTSKTAAEVAEIHAALGLAAPVIVENGAGIILAPKDAEAAGNAHFFGKPYAELIPLVHKIRADKEYCFQGFSDFSVAEVMAATGLDEQAAILARQRLGSEPIIWQDSPEALARFRQELAGYNLQLLRGGRFFHILDNRADKGTAVHWLLGYFRRQQAHPKLFSVALGDGPNDRAMMEAVDLAVIIPNPSGIAPEPRCGKILHAKQPGPSGWNRAIHDILLLYTDKGAEHG